MRPFRVLVRHFFERLFQNDVFPFEDQMKEKLYVLLAMLATLAWHVANTVFSAYMFFPDAGESWAAKAYFLSFFMALLAFAVSLEWDVLFLDRRDHLNLVVLPIRRAALFGAKFLSFFVFVAMYAAAVNALSVFDVAFFLPKWIDESLGTLLRYMAAHVVATTAAFVFAFLAVVFLEACLLVALPRGIFRAASLLVRSALFVGCVFGLLAALGAPGPVVEIFDGLAKGRGAGGAAAFLPPIWYTGLYETIIGRATAFDLRAAATGLAAIAVLGPAVFLGLALGFRRHAGSALEVAASRPRWRRAAGEALASLFDAAVLRNPVERAVFHFFGRAVRRSSAHKVRWAGYGAFAVGFILLMLGFRASPLGQPRTAGPNALAAPLILMFFVLLGLRSIVNRPLSAEANWVFRLTESEDKSRYIIGLRKAVLFFAILPVVAAVGAAFAFAWGPGPALLHAVYAGAFGLFLREILFWRYAKIPFSCSTVPGKTRLYAFWLVYLLGTLLGLTAFAALERSLFRRGGFGTYFGIAAVLWAASAYAQRRIVNRKLALVYEEEPEPVVLSLVRE